MPYIKVYIGSKGLQKGILSRNLFIETSPEGIALLGEYLVQEDKDCVYFSNVPHILYSKITEAALKTVAVGSNIVRLSSDEIKEIIDEWKEEEKKQKEKEQEERKKLEEIKKKIKEEIEKPRIPLGKVENDHVKFFSGETERLELTSLSKASEYLEKIRNLDLKELIFKKVKECEEKVKEYEKKIKKLTDHIWDLEEKKENLTKFIKEKYTEEFVDWLLAKRQEEMREELLSRYNLD